MKIVFTNSQDKKNVKKYGPFKSVRLIHEWLVGDDDEIAITKTEKSEYDFNLAADYEPCSKYLQLENYTYRQEEPYFAEYEKIKGDKLGG